MQTSQLFKVQLLFLIFSISLTADEIYLKFDQKLMDADWSFLPEVPEAFEENTYTSKEIGFTFKNIKASYKSSEIDLQLQRSTEPKDVALYADKEDIKIGYLYNEKHYLYLLSSEQLADPQAFNCYEFGTFILGSCDQADLQISSSNPKYDVLGDNIISIAGNVESYGVGYQRYFNNFWISSSKIEIINTNYSYNWLSPLEDIKSPFLLNLSVNGVILGDALTTALERLPQRTDWESLQLNIGIKQKFISIYNFNLITEYDLVLLEFSDYREYKNTPKYNFRLRAGVEFYVENLSLLFYGDAYLNNLIGFEPITFNQRTEHYFDKPYGELGLKFKLKLKF
jgi:hypothetical protein